MGLAVSAVMKYGDSIIKIMCTAMSVIVTGLIETVYLGITPSLSFVAGGALIFYSVVAWSKVPKT